MDDKIKAGTVLNVLLLEDSVKDFEIIREQLANAGYKLNIVRVEKKDEFISSIHNNKYDIILADFKLPGFDATSALSLCKEICPEVPFICVSGSIGEETAIELIKQGAVDYVLKDRLTRLPSGINRALDEAKEKEKRKLAEKLLESQCALLSALINSASEIIIFSLDKNYCYTAFNEAHRKEMKLLWNTDINIGMNHLDCMQNRELRELAKVSIDRALKGEMFSEIQHQSKLATYYEFSWSPVFQNSEIIGATVFIRNITERILAEEELIKYRDHLEELVKDRTNELAKSRNMLRTLIDSLPDEIYAKDIESRFIMANYPILRTFGLSAFKDILGKTDFDLLPGEEAEKSYTKEHSVLQHDGQMINYEDQIINSDNKIHWHAVTKIPMRDKEGNVTGLVGINRDITYFKEIEEILKKAKETAEAANLAKSTFLSNMSHEIRTPLNAILGFSELMQVDKKISKEHKEWLRTINRSGEHLLALINDILEISRIEAGRITYNPTTFDLHALLCDIEAMFRIKTDEKNLTLLFEYSDKLPKYVVTDEGKLRQIIINLVGNAVKFTKEGGVAFRTLIKHENDKMQFIAEVEDTGPGVSKKDIDKLFQKFGQTEAGIKEGGTGLGLAISQQYAKIMGGEITLRSKEGEGTCFTLTINIENGAEFIKEENQKRRVIGLKPGQKLYRILVADDRADNRELLKIMLTSVGFEVEEAQNGNETIAKFKVWSPDLILMDMRMPVMDGYETTQKIKAMENGKIRIIAVTASAFQEDRQKVLTCGADAYLRKPFKEHEVFECIEKCLKVQYVYE